ncbi:MAG: T9SS type A sorting domain-containing protein, partial [Bacteroidales bacterium]|nr:T9SS type A sorting domain-containing protein [Bacteroidales bacterium]
FPFCIEAQTAFGFGFVRSNTPTVIVDGHPLSNAWAGGLNSVKFSEIDLNLDGVKDLFAFEKNGNRILPFLNLGGNPPHFQYAPEYIRFFPKLHDWAILIDYNGDGKEDLFTYSLAGIAIYKNISETALAFELVEEQLQAYYYNGYSNLFASPDDYLVIADVDGDGDLDMLNFFILGKNVHYIKNWAIELHQNAEIFDMRLEEECWGHFSESADNNVITLFTDCQSKISEELFSETRHIGSTMTLLDVNHDNLQDIVIGDVDYPSLTLLVNGGTPADALMVSQTNDFPNSTTPVNLFSMPVVSLAAVSGNAQQDLIVSPSDPSLTKSQDFESVWLYSYNSELDEYQLTNKSFLQDEMIEVGSGAYPIFYDWNQDGLTDLFVANYGKYDSSTFNNGTLHSYYASSIAYFENTGNLNQPEFTLKTSDFGNLKSYNFQALYPTFGDFNEDHKIDMLCGLSNGTLLWVANNTTDPNTLSFNPPVFNWQNIDVGDFSTPQYYDIDGDGKKELLIGNRRGKISYYQDISSTNIPQFQLITDIFGAVDVRDEELSYFGYSVPCFFQYNNQTYLFCANEQGIIAIYDEIDGHLDGTFHRIFPNVFELYQLRRCTIEEGVRVGVSVSDLDQDGFPELVVGNWAGGLAFFQGVLFPDSTISAHSIAHRNQYTLYPNPVLTTVTLNSSANTTKGQLYIYSITGQVLYAESINSFPIAIEVAFLKSGLYFVEINDPNGKYCLKFVKNGSSN